MLILSALRVSVVTKVATWVNIYEVISVEQELSRDSTDVSLYGEVRSRKRTPLLNGAIHELLAL